MSAMERRLQLLLDQHRYDMVAREAHASGRSVAAVIREAIDQHFAPDDARARRQEAAGRLLERTRDRAGQGVDEGDGESTEPDWADVKETLNNDLVARVPLR